MGVTINHKLAQERRYLKITLDRAEKFAKLIKKEQADVLGISFEIRRPDENTLLIDIGECETLEFEFLSWKEMEGQAKKDGFSYAYASLEDYKHFEDDHSGEHYDRYPDQKLLWCAAFCKTQFADSLVEHRWVAELIRAVASMCMFSVINDEGDYYHTLEIKDAERAIGENGRLIDSLGATLAKSFGPENVVTGGKTKIKPRN